MLTAVYVWFWVEFKFEATVIKNLEEFVPDVLFGYVEGVEVGIAVGGV